MAKHVEIPPEVTTAAEKCLEMGVSHTRARDLFRFALITRAIEREGGNQAAAARKLGMTRQQISDMKTVLEPRLA